VTVIITAVKPSSKRPGGLREIRGGRFAYEAKVVWQRPPELGLQFIRGYRFDEVPSEPLRKAIASEY
jgi:hypothetical protein